MPFAKPVNPFTLETAGEYPLLDLAAIRVQAGAARAAYHTWRKIPVAERVQALRAGLEYFRDNGPEIARDITDQMGKPMVQAENELKGFFERAEYLLSIAEDTLAPETPPPKPGFLRRIEHEPLGVVLIVAPWNYPLLTAVNGVMAALVAGNAVLLKHSEATAAVGEHFARAFGRLGPVEGALRNFLASHEDIDALIAEGGVDHLVFTGSVPGGRTVERCASAAGIGCNLELGGKDAAYVAEDADLEKAAADLVDGAMYNAGQSCCGIERVYAHRSLHDAFAARCRELASAYVLGDPRDRATTMGPLAMAKSAQVLKRQVEEARALGAKVLCGGGIRLIGKATYFEPTVITGANHSMSLMREENFGPLLPIMAVAGDEEAIRLVGDSRYGLTAAIYTRDLERAERFARTVDTGTVFLNRCDYLDPALPWTGLRDSGRGSSLSKYGLLALTRRKSIHFRLPEPR